MPGDRGCQGFEAQSFEARGREADALLPKVDKVLLICMDQVPRWFPIPLGPLQVASCEGEIREKPESVEEAKGFLESYRRGLL